MHPATRGVHDPRSKEVRSDTLGKKPTIKNNVGQASQLPPSRQGTQFINIHTGAAVYQKDDRLQLPKIANGKSAVCSSMPPPAYPPPHANRSSNSNTNSGQFLQRTPGDKTIFIIFTIVLFWPFWHSLKCKLKHFSEMQLTKTNKLLSFWCILLWLIFNFW